MRGLKVIFEQQVQLKVHHRILKKITVLNIYCVVDVFSKYTWVKNLKNEKVKTVPYGFVEGVNESNRNPNT